MKKLIMTTLALALFAGPAFASCGSHGGGYGGYGASRTAQPKYSALPRSTPAKAKVTTNQTATKQADNTGGAASDAAKAKPGSAPAATAQPLKTATADLDAATAAPAAAPQECKKYSATIGAMISVACE